MSRSKHQTWKSVFGGLSKPPVDAVISENDEDFQELQEKRRIKQVVKKRRRQERLDDLE